MIEADAYIVVAYPLMLVKIDFTDYLEAVTFSATIKGQPIAKLLLADIAALPSHIRRLVPHEEGKELLVALYRGIEVTLPGTYTADQLKLFGFCLP
jgi:hypothetical protein